MTIQRDLSNLDARAAPAVGQGLVSEADLAALFDQAAGAHAALMRGEVATYFEMVAPAPDLVLMTPVGGCTRRSEPFSAGEMQEMTSFFRGGAGTAELLGSYASGDLAVLVMIERARARIAEFPEQDWALRVTLVFRRQEAGWRLAHRHADPLVARIGWDRSADLARG